MHSIDIDNGRKYDTNEHKNYFRLGLHFDCYDSDLPTMYFIL